MGRSNARRYGRIIATTLDPSCAHGGQDHSAFLALGRRTLAPRRWRWCLVLASLSAEEQSAGEENEGWPKSSVLGAAPA